jgi:uncharacterized protein
MNEQNNVIIFCKYPVEGNVKTRIANTIGNEIAVNLYKLLSEYIFQELLKTEDVFQYLFYDNYADRDKIKNWAGGEFSFELQEGNDLGDKMYNAFKKVIDRGSTKTIIVGTDVPDISSDIIQKAFLALNNSDVVIGPARDGGYYLLGIKKLYRSFFTGIEWSKDTVLKKTLEKINSLDLSYSMLPELIDIDTEEDLKNWLANDTENANNLLKNEIKTIYAKKSQFK